MPISSQLLGGGTSYLHLFFATSPTWLDLTRIANGILPTIAAAASFPLMGVLFGRLVDDMNAAACVISCNARNLTVRF
jgi:hypothetical protein